MTAVIVRTVIPKATVHTVTHTEIVTQVIKHQALKGWSNQQQIVQKPLKDGKPVIYYRQKATEMLNIV